VNKNRGGEELLTEESWNGDMRGDNVKSSLFETLSFTKKLDK
jgi:hypothetical protein